MISSDRIQKVHFDVASGWVALLVCFLAAVSGCRIKDREIPTEPAKLTIHRLEQDLFAPGASLSPASVDTLLGTYGDFLHFYFGNFAGWQADSPNIWKDSILAYASDPFLQELYDSVQLKFASLEPLQTSLSRSFGYFSYYFPEAIIPEIITLINGPGRGSFTYGDSILCIALEDYMDPGFSFYRYQEIPAYLLRRFRQEYMVPNCLQVVLTREYPFEPGRGKLLDAMIHQGKLAYVKSKCMPGAPDSLTTGFSRNSLDWCADHEKEIWKFFTSRDLIYSTDPMQFMKYVTDGPTTSGMPESAPGNVGSWVGWRMVIEYMKKNPHVSLKQLMEEQDAQKILTGSQYKP